MAATSYDSLVNDVALEVPGAPYPLIISRINLAARELCLQAECWAEWQDITLEADVDEYAIAAPNGSATIRHIKYVMLNDKELAPDTNENIVRTKPWLMTQSGNISAYYLLPDMQIKLLPKPSADDAGKIAKVYAAFIPSLDATAIPSVLMDRNAEILIDGAKAKLLSIANQPWTNPQQAAYYDQNFKLGVTKARIDVETDYGRADLAVTRRRFR